MQHLENVSTMSLVSYSIWVEVVPFLTHVCGRWGTFWRFLADLFRAVRELVSGGIVIGLSVWFWLFRVVFISKGMV